MKIGMDIGYSGVKVVHGNAAQDQNRLVMPVGVAPSDWLGSMGLQSYDGVPVRVGGEDNVAGVEPYLIPGGGRVLDKDYTNSTQYMALFYAALKQVGAPVIDCLATGLPVSLYKVEEIRQGLVDRLRGVHRLDGQAQVDVRSVKVFPQPIGTFISYVADAENGAQAMADKSVLIVDPGFYSVDSVALKHGRPFPGGAATSTEAMSRVLELADEHLTREYLGAGETPGKLKGDLERALRLGRTTLSIANKDVDADDALRAAADTVSRRALPSILSSIRGTEFNLDMVLFGGGGAHLYAPGVMTQFKGQAMAIAQNAPMANARGFYLLVS